MSKEASSEVALNVVEAFWQKLFGSSFLPTIIKQIQARDVPTIC